MSFYKIKLAKICVIFGSLLLVSSTSIALDTPPKHILVAYDLSLSMSHYWNKEDIERINTYLVRLLFDGEIDISPYDKVILRRETLPFGKDRPLLQPGDRLSFIGFGGPPIPDPEFTTVYNLPSLKEEFKRILPAEKARWNKEWTCLDLLYWKVSQVFRAYPYKLNLRLLISDKSESRYPLSLEDQHRILEYKDLYRETNLLDIQVGAIHLELTEIIPPLSGIEIIDPKPWEVHLAGKPLLLRAKIIKEGKVLKEEDWKVEANIKMEDKREGLIQSLTDDGRGDDEVASDGIYSGKILCKGGGEVSIIFKAAKGPMEFKSKTMRLMLSKSAGQPYWLYTIILFFIGLFIYYRLGILRFWIEVEGSGRPPCRVELRRIGDILYLGKRESDPYIDLGLPQYSLVREKRSEVVLWREGMEEGEIIRWGRWFTPKNEEGITLRFSIARPKSAVVRLGIPRVRKDTGDFYKW